MYKDLTLTKLGKLLDKFLLSEFESKVCKFNGIVLEANSMTITHSHEIVFYKSEWVADCCYGDYYYERNIVATYKVREGELFNLVIDWDSFEIITIK